MPYPVAAVRGHWMIGGAVSAGWWDAGGTIPAANCIAAYQPKGAASLAASYTNLANPGTYNAAPGSAPDWDSTNGWKFDGTSDFLTTGITPTLSWTGIVRFSNHATVANGYYFGAYNGANQNFAIVQYTATSKYYFGYQVGDTLSVEVTSTAAAVVAVAGKNAYRNGSSDGTIPAGGSNPTYTIYIGVVNTTGGGPNFAFADAHYCQAMAFYDITLDATTVAALTTAMNAL